MNLQADSEHNSSQDVAVPLGFAGKPPSSLGPKTVVNPERRNLRTSESHDLTPTELAKRRRLFPGDDPGSSVSPHSDSQQIGPAGVELAHFVVEEPIGRGGMGAVYRAIDQRLQRVVALKVLSPEQSQTENSVQRFLNEARSSARLDHDNIARVYFVGEDDGLHFIAYEYVTGVNIRDLIHQHGRLSPAEAINYTLQVAAALKHTSAAGVVHRDVKPSNIIVTPIGRAKLVDLGLARKEYTESVDELTVAGTTLGTFDYISPEQAKDPRNVDVRSDIYSLGCTLYQMLTGEPPYPEGTMYQKLLKHDSKEPPDPAQKNRRVPPELSAVVRKMMASEPGRRYRDADELIADLMAVAGGLGIRTVSPDGLVWAAEMTERPPGFVRRHIGWMATAAALVIVVFLLDQFGERLTPNTETPIASSRNPSAQPTANNRNNTSTSPGLTNDSLNGNDPDRVAIAAGGNSDINPKTVGPPGIVGNQVIEPRDITLPAESGGLNDGGSNKPDTDIASATTSGSRPVESTNNKPLIDDSPGATDTPKSPMPPETTGNTDTPESFPQDGDDEPQISLVSNGESKAFNTLEAACHDAPDGSVIILRHNGPRPDAEKPLRLNNKRITIRGEKGFRPVIDFRPVVDAAGDLPTRLITLLGGASTSVELINLDIHIVLPENVDPALEWALFSLRGAKQVRLRDVRVTFENADGRAAATLIELTSGPSANLTDMKMMKEKPGNPRAEFEVRITDSIIRGGCDVFHVAYTRPGRFSVEQSVIAVDGTLLSVVGDHEMPDESDDLELHLEHVTALLGNGLIHWNSGSEPRSVLPVHVTSRDNIFSTKSDRPLISMDGNSDPDDFRKLLHWSGERNFYDRFVKFWAIPSGLQTNETPPYGFDRWKDFWGPATELDPNGELVVWKSPWWTRDYIELTAEHLQLDSDAGENAAISGALNGSDAGADLQELQREPLTKEQPAVSDFPED